MYAQSCYNYCHYQECIDTTTRILSMAEAAEVEESILCQVKLIKGKSLYHSYQGEQKVFQKVRKNVSLKDSEKLRTQCYAKTKECILLLGSGYDNGFLDLEGDQLLDLSMIDFVRETNNLNQCKRCLLCRKKTAILRSHIFPKSILKDIASDMAIGGDHKVFIPMLGKKVKKSAGEATFWMFCSRCEQLLCQNGENQFFEQIYKKIQPDHTTIPSELKLPYGRWMYDFCVGILIRALAVSDASTFGRDSDNHPLFSWCRQRLLSLELHSKKHPESASKPTAELSTYLTRELTISVLVNPVIVSSGKGNESYLSKLPGMYVSPVRLEDGVYSHSRQSSFFLAHFGTLNIVIQFLRHSLDDSALRSFNIIVPSGGILEVPVESKRWQTIPAGVWQMFSAFSQVDNMDQNSSESPYPLERSVQLNNVRVMNHLPSEYNLTSGLISVVVPSNLNVIMRTKRKWGEQQVIRYSIIADPMNENVYLVYILSLPGLLVVDGMTVEKHKCTLSIPFLDRRTECFHPIMLSVIQDFVSQVKEISECIVAMYQLS